MLAFPSALCGSPRKRLHSPATFTPQAARNSVPCPLSTVPGVTASKPPSMPPPHIPAPRAATPRGSPHAALLTLLWRPRALHRAPGAAGAEARHPARTVPEHGRTSRTWKGAVSRIWRRWAAPGHGKRRKKKPQRSAAGAPSGTAPEVAPPGLVLLQPKGAQRGCQDPQLLLALAPGPAASDESPAPLGARRWETRGLLRPSSGTGLLAPQLLPLEPSYQTPSPRSPLAPCASWKAVSDPSLL